MKFLLDVCTASRIMQATLLEHGHDVVSAIDIDPGATDEALLTFAYDDDRVILTEDKDFGELVFVHQLPNPCIVRFVDMTISEKVDAMLELIEQYSASMRSGTLIVVSPNRIRIRSTNNSS